MGRLLAGFAATASLLGIACAHRTGIPPDPGQSGSQTLRYRFREGQVDRYAIDIVVRIEDMSERAEPIRGSARYTLKTDRVQPDGGALLRAATDEVRFGGKSTPGSAAPLRFYLSPRGEARPAGAGLPGVEREFADPFALGRLTTLLPDHAVRPGDSWTVSAPNPLTGKGTVVSNCRFFRLEKSHGVDTARIHQTYTLPIRMALRATKADAEVKVEGALAVAAAVHFDPAAGRVVKSEVTGQGRMKLMETGSRRGEAQSSECRLVVEATSDLTL